MPKMTNKSLKLVDSTILRYNKLIDNVLPLRCANIQGRDDKDRSLIMSAIVSRFSMACGFCGSQEAIAGFSMKTQLIHCIKCKDKHNEHIIDAQQARCKTPTKVEDDLPTKQCTGTCGQTLPATTEFFHRSQTGKYGLNAMCKVCRLKHIKEQKEHPTVELNPPREGYKRCTGPCGQEYPATTEYWSPNKLGKYGLRPMCKECCNQNARNKNSLLPTRSRYIKFSELYNRMMEKQGGVCAVCKMPETRRSLTGQISPLAVDHDHETGRIRALLCSKCNTSLGMMGEDPDRIRALAEYAEWCRMERES
jgi:hypothetical protein